MTLSLNDTFCKEVGIKQASCYIINEDTSEIKFYSNKNSIYKPPKNWIHTSHGIFSNPLYPDLINNAENFLLLLNLHFTMFGSLGSVYYKLDNESFQECYLKTRLQAIRACKSYGGSYDFGLYLEEVRSLPFNYLRDDFEEP